MNDDIIEERDLRNHTKSISIDILEIILKQMKNCICRIECNSHVYATGFFCNIPYDDYHSLKVLITNNHVLGEEDIRPGKIIKYSFYNSLPKEITIDESRLTFTIKKYDVTFIQIKDKDYIKIESFLDIDSHINEGDPDIVYSEKPVYLLHYPEGKEVKLSEGLINSITMIDNKYINIQHFCDSRFGSSGAPILNSKNNKVIGIHKGGSRGGNWNLGSFFREPIKEFIEKIKAHMQNYPNFNNNNFISNNMNINIIPNDMNNNIIPNNMNLNDYFQNFIGNNNNNNNTNNYLDNMNNMINNMINNMNEFNINSPSQPSKGENEILINFTTNLGHKMEIKARRYITVGILLKIYLRKIGLEEKNIGKDLLFLYNGANITNKSDEKMFDKDDKVFNIIVMDVNNLISSIIHIFFINSNNKILITACNFITFEELFKKFAKEIGFDEKVIKENIYFSIKGKKVNFNSKEKLKTKLSDNCEIDILDEKKILGEIINITFSSTSGFIIVIEVFNNIKIKELIKIYFRKIDLDDKYVKDIFFLFNAKSLEHDCEKRVNELFREDYNTIMVLDQKNYISLSTFAYECDEKK